MLLVILGMIMIPFILIAFPVLLDAALKTIIFLIVVSLGLVVFWACFSNNAGFLGGMALLFIVSIGWRVLSQEIKKGSALGSKPSVLVGGPGSVQGESEAREKTGCP